MRACYALLQILLKIRAENRFTGDHCFIAHYHITLLPTQMYTEQTKRAVQLYHVMMMQFDENHAFIFMSRLTQQDKLTEGGGHGEKEKNEKMGKAGVKKREIRSGRCIIRYQHWYCVICLNSLVWIKY